MVDINRGNLEGIGSHSCREVRKVSRYLHRGEGRADERNRRKPQVIQSNGKEKSIANEQGFGLLVCSPTKKKKLLIHKNNKNSRQRCKKSFHDYLNLTVRTELSSYRPNFSLPSLRRASPPAIY